MDALCQFGSVVGCLLSCARQGSPAGGPSAKRNQPDKEGDVPTPARRALQLVRHFVLLKECLASVQHFCKSQREKVAGNAASDRPDYIFVQVSLKVSIKVL